MTYTEDDWQRVIWKMCNLSPSARERLPTERWRYSLANDEENSRDVAFELNVNILHDLEDIGIYFTTDPMLIFTDDKFLEDWLDTLAYIVPATFYLEMRDDKGFKDCLYNLLSGSLDGDPLLNYLQWLKLSKPHLGSIIDLVKSNLKSDQVYIDFLNGQHDLINEEILHHGHLSVNAIKRIHDFTKRLEEGFKTFKDELPQELKEKLTDNITLGLNDIYKRCSDPYFSETFSWWLSVKQKDLPLNQRRFYLKTAREIHAQLPFSEIYFKLRDMDYGTLQHQIQALLFNYACNKYILTAPKTNQEENNTILEMIVSHLKKG